MTTLLNGVNAVLQRTDILDSNNNLSTLTDTARQGWIDQVVQIWNEEMESLYETARKPMPKEFAEATITLATDDRDYALATYHTLYFPLLDETNGRYIYEWRSGYLNLVNSQPVPSNWSGLPNFAAIRPSDGELYLDRVPTASENGLVYKYRYSKDISMSAAADTFPFNDAVYRALIPAVAEKFNLERKREFSETKYKAGVSKAARLLSGLPIRTTYGPHRVQLVDNLLTPFNEN